MFYKYMLTNKVILLVLLSITSGCKSDNKTIYVLPDHFFTKNGNVKKFYFIGKVNHIGVSKYDAASCPDKGICLHLPAWNLYEIEGYNLPESNNEIESIIVAHKYGSALVSNVPWLATLEKIDDDSLKEKIGADYILVGVELGINIFCSNKTNKKLFKDWESDIKDMKTSQNCFSL